MQLFDPEHWKEQGAVVGNAQGRGSTLLLETTFGPAVLRQYLRGGWAARVSRDRYRFSGFDQSRPVKEFRLLEQLTGAGLPVPAPLAALCVREGSSYKAWLLMARIMNVEPLADLIEKRHEDPLLWEGVGKCIRLFHDFGLIHADLNARNILLDADDKVYLIDFDRSRISKGDSAACSANLRRLHRSLQKVWPKPMRGYLERCWTRLLAGYDVTVIAG